MIQVRLDIIGGCVIEVDQFQITPASSHLFGLLLFLSLRSGRPTSRKDLQALMAEGDASAPASHNLRQLLYRLRGIGLRFEEDPTGIMLHDVTIVGPLDMLLQRNVRERSRLPLSSLEVLPSYAPPLPQLFLSWLDELRSELDGRLRRLFLADLEEAQASHSWADVENVCEKLLSLDAANDEVARSRAEALAMTGRRDDAMLLIDTFVANSTLNAQALARLQSMRERIRKSTFTRREGTLRARETCLAYLQSEWERVAAEGARLTAVLGVAGLGKTRVAEAFASRIALRGGHVLRFECDSQARQQPLSLFSHILPALRTMRGSLGASPEYMASLALIRPAADSSGLAIEEGMSLEARRANIQAGLIDLLEAVTSERPMLLVVDDAHQLDEASRAVLRALTATRNAALLHVLVCARPSSGNASLLAPSRRSTAYELTALSRQDSKDLLLELCSDSRSDEQHVEWCLVQAAGNPFYLHQLAMHHPSTAVPFDIGSLALSAYWSLKPESRSLLETCLLLGRFATLDRAMLVSGGSELGTLPALRELEEQDLVHYSDGLLSGPHALLHDALRALIPSTVSALLHRRIAVQLENECLAEEFSPELAWASAQSWLACGDPSAATRLIRQCARHAADVGEPGAAIDLLSQMPRTALPPHLLAELLDDLSEFAGVGASPAVAVTALRDRWALARQRGEDGNRVRLLELRLLEAELINGGTRDAASPGLHALLTNSAASGAVRVQAGTRLLALADSDFDSASALAAYSLIRNMDAGDESVIAYVDAAGLIYHSAFGDPDVAHNLASALLAVYPHPTRSSDSLRTRMHTALALCRIGYPEEAGTLCERQFEYTMSHHLYGDAFYAASLLVDIAIGYGDFDAAQRWFDSAQLAARDDAPHELSPMAGFGSNAGTLAMRQGRYEDAREYFRAPLGQYKVLAGARFRGFMLARLLRIEQLSRGANLARAEVDLLRELYDKGKRFGGQDTAVEALWCASILNGDSASASRLLREYLLGYRRERSTPEWSLRNASAADEAWLEYDSCSDVPFTPKSQLAGPIKASTKK